MLKRKRRKGFWWYSWILILLAIGGTVGGYFYANQVWEKGPKEYRSVAILEADIRKPFAQGKMLSDTEGVNNSSQTEAKRILNGLGTLRPVLRELNLANTWVLDDSEALKILSESVDVDISQKDEISITVTRDSPQEAADIANAISRQALTSLAEMDERKRTEAAERLDEKISEARKPVLAALAKAAAAMKANGLPLEPTLETNLRPFFEITEVLEASVELEDAKDDLEDVQQSQSNERSFWDTALNEIKVVQEAVAPARFSGPDKQPIQKEFALWGLTLGLLLGLILMLLLWKLFSPKRD